MVKHRFSTHDVAAEVGCLKQKFLGFRLANVYDINAKVWFIWRFGMYSSEISKKWSCGMHQYCRIAQSQFRISYQAQQYLHNNIYCT